MTIRDGHHHCLFERFKRTIQMDDSNGRFKWKEVKLEGNDKN